MKMNKKKNICLAVATLVLLCNLLTACGTKEASNDPIVGTWNMATISDGQNQIKAKEYLASAKLAKLPKMTFTADEKVTFDTGKDTGTSKWEKKDALYIITDETQTPPVTMKFTLNGTQFSITQGEYQMTFEKQ